MRGIQIQQYVKSPRDLEVTDLPDPAPRDDEYTVSISAAAANFFDILQVQGRYQNQPAFPWIAGAEFAGTITATPKSSAPLYAPGTRVFGAAQGAFATTVCVPGVSLLPIPEGWSFEDAAGLFVTAPTSYGALVLRAGVGGGDWVLVHAAAGGLAWLPSRVLAKAFGATVVATASSAHKLAVAKSYGADHAVSYSDADWPDQVRALTPGRRGVDIVFDPVGLVDRSTRCTAWNGRILVVGFAAGSIEKVAMNKVLLKNISLVGVHWGAYALHQRDAIPEVWEGIMRLVAEGKFRGTHYLDEEFVGLDRVGDALVALAGRGTWGKVIIKVPGDQPTSKL